MKFSASMWEGNKVRWEEQLLQLKTEIFKGKMQNTKKSLQDNTFIGSWDLLSARAQSSRRCLAHKVIRFKVLLSWDSIAESELSDP